MTIQKVLQYINEASVGIALLTFLLIVVMNMRSGRAMKLEDILVRVMAASAIPTALALLCCAFNPAFLQSLTGFNIHIATAGLALLFISAKGMAGTKMGS